MLKHRKRISIFTLAVFMLTLLFAGITPAFAAAKTAPGSAPAAEAPASSGEKDNPNRVSPEGDAVKSSIGQGPILKAELTPYLADLKVYAGTEELALSPGFESWREDYEVQAKSGCESLRLVIDPQVNLESWYDQEKTNWVKVECGSWSSTYQVRNNPGIIIDTNSTVGSGTPSPIPLRAAGEDTTITITVKNEDDPGEDGSGSRSKVYTVKVKRHVAPWLESMKVTGPSPIPYYVNDSEAPLALQHTVNVPENCEAVQLELDPRDILKGTWRDPQEYTSKVVVSSDYPSSTTFNNNSSLSNFQIDTDLLLKPAGEDTTVTMTLYSNKGEMTVYTLTVHRLLAVKSVALEMDEQVQLVENAQLLMSEKMHTLKAVLTPANANFPEPLIYDWVVIEEDPDSVNAIPDGDELDIYPDSDNPGQVQVAVNVKDRAGNIYASASCRIFVGKIEIRLEGEPLFNPDGSYEASFGYNNNFPVEVMIPKTGNIGDVELDCWRDMNSFWGSDDVEVIEGERPAVFAPGNHEKVFRIKYLNGYQTWLVAYEGRLDKAEAGTYQSVRLNENCLIMGLDDDFQLVADPSFYRNSYARTEDDELLQEEIVWDIVWQSSRGVVDIDGRANDLTCNVEAQKPGSALVRVSIGANNCGDQATFSEKHKKRQAFCFVTVLDNRTLTLDQDEITIRKNKTAELNALIDYEDLFTDHENYSFGLPRNWNEVQWGFILENEQGRKYIVDASEYVSLTSSGVDETEALIKGLTKGQAEVVAYLGNNFYSKKVQEDIGVPREYISEMETQCFDWKLYLDRIPEDRYDTCIVNIKNKKRVEEVVEEKAKPAPTPAPPAAPALETLDVILTVGSNLATVNGQQVILAGNTLLIGEDRAMVDYPDITKLLPGVSYAWDWQTQTVTYTKGDKSVSMKLDQVPADFDVPFMNLAGRLVVPVRYVGAFFGATVDWDGNKFVVHMYK